MTPPTKLTPARAREIARRVDADLRAEAWLAERQRLEVAWSQEDFLVSVIGGLLLVGESDKKPKPKPQ